MSIRRLTIGEFSKLCRLTVVALRHYDRVGVLTPAETDPSTGYRYYHLDQVREALRIGLLRSLDVSLPELGRLAAGATTFDEMLATQRSLLMNQIHARQRMLAVIDALVEHADARTYDITRGVEPSTRVVALTIEASWTRIESATRHGLARLAVALRRHGVAPRTATGALFPISPREHVSVTVFAADVARAADAGDGAWGRGPAPLVLPRVDAISTTHRGDHRLLGYAYHALLGEVAARGLEPTGPAREHYSTGTDGVACTRVVIPVGQNAP